MSHPPTPFLNPSVPSVHGSSGIYRLGVGPRLAGARWREGVLGAFSRVEGMQASVRRNGGGCHISLQQGPPSHQGSMSGVVGAAVLGSRVGPPSQPGTDTPEALQNLFLALRGSILPAWGCRG